MRRFGRRFAMAITLIAALSVIASPAVASPGGRAAGAPRGGAAEAAPTNVAAAVPDLQASGIEPASSATRPTADCAAPASTLASQMRPAPSSRTCAQTLTVGPIGGFVTVPKRSTTTPAATGKPTHLTPKLNPADTTGTYTISGKVTGPGGAPLADIDINANGTNGWGNTTSSSTGDYSIVVTPDTYTLSFDDWSMAHASGWYSSTAANGYTPLSDAATPVTVTTASVTGRNIQLPTAYAISGTITAAGAVPLENINVTVYSATYRANAQTMPDGTFMVGVPSGTYTVAFDDWTYAYASGYWTTGGFTRAAASASPLVVTTAARAGINAVLPKNPLIRGTVKGVGGVALSGIRVSTETADTWDRISSATTAANGTYAIPVPPGAFHVMFADPAAVYATGYYVTGGFTVDGNAATAVTVGAADVTGINITLPKAVHIKGKITGPGGLAAANINVEANGGGYGNAITAADGTYSMAVAPGVYRVSAQDYTSPAVYAEGWAGPSGFTLDAGAAAAFVVTTADVTLNLQVPKLVHIKGKVTGPGGVALSGITVASSGQLNSGEATTQADGSYSLPVPPSNNWSIQFYDPTGAHLSGFYRSTGFTLDPNLATSISVAAVDVSLATTITLPLSLHITGKVTKAGGVGLPSINVTASSLTYVARATTAADGTYSLGLPAGSYTVAFTDDWSGVYSAGFYTATGYSSNASKAVVVSTASVGGVSVQMPARTAVSGVVTTTGGVGLAGIEVNADGTAQSMTSTSFSATTAANGSYTLKLPPGTFVIRFGDPSRTRTSAYYAGASVTLNPNRATQLLVGTTAITGINAKLAANLHIKGKLTGPGGVPLAGVDVSARAYVYTSGTTTAADGTWSLAVPAGSYGISFSKYNNVGSVDYGYYSTTGLKPTITAATVVTVTSADVTGINAQVASVAMHKIAGAVTGASAGALPGIEVCASSASAYACASTSATGAYALSVPAGSFTVEFRASGGRAEGVFSGGYWSSTGLKFARSGATAVVVGSTDVTGINAALPRSLHITGRVTTPNGVGLASAAIWASGNGSWLVGSVGPDGRYTLSVPPGSYRLEFDPSWSIGGSGRGIVQSAYPWGWYGASGFTTVAPATVTLTTANLAGINIAFPKPVWLAGRLTKSGGAGIGGVYVSAVNSANYGSSVMTAQDGQWSLVVAAGTYTVSYNDADENWSPILRLPDGWYASAGFALAKASATSIVVGTTNTLTINTVAPAARRISGYVLGANKLPLDSINVSAATTGYSTTTYSDYLGSWVVPVTAASYKVQYSNLGGMYQGGYYSTAGLTTSSASATLISTVAADVPGVVVLLPRDTAAPTASAPSTVARVGAAVSGTTVPVTVSWTGADNAGGVGVAKYALTKSTDGGTTWTVLSGSITATSYATSVAAAGTVMFSVRPTDAAGNIGAWVTGPKLTPVLAQTASGVTYTGTWSTQTSTAAFSGGSTRYSSSAGASATYSFTGRSVALVMTKASSRGAIRIYVDGSASYVTLDTIATTTLYQAVVWQKSWTASGAHKVKIVVVGTSGRPRVDFDAVVVLK